MSHDMCVLLCVPYTGVMEYIETGSGVEEALSELETDKLTEEALRTVFAGVHTAVASALRLPRLKSEVSSILYCTHNIQSQ